MKQTEKAFEEFINDKMKRLELHLQGMEDELVGKLMDKPTIESIKDLIRYLIRESALALFSKEKEAILLERQRIKEEVDKIDIERLVRQNLFDGQIDGDIEEDVRKALAKVFEEEKNE